MLEQEKAAIILDPHLGDLFECISGGALDYSSEYSKRQQAIHCSRTKANLRRDHIVERVRKRFDDKPGVSTKETQQLFLLLINGVVDDEIHTIAIRFNKLDEDGKCANSTLQASLFYNQEPLEQVQEEAPGIPAATTHVVGTYELNTVGTSVSSVVLSCPNGTATFAWHIPLTAAMVLAPVVDLAKERAQQQSQKKARQVRGRKETKEEKKLKSQEGNGGSDG